MTLGVRYATQDKLRRLSFNLNLSHGQIVDLLCGNVPLVYKKLSNQQKRMMRLTILRISKKAVNSLRIENK